MATNLPSCFSIQFLEQLLKFLVNFTLLKYVKSQRRYGFLITKKLIFGFQILDLKDHFSASLICFYLTYLCAKFGLRSFKDKSVIVGRWKIPLSWIQVKHQPRSQANEWMQKLSKFNWLIKLYVRLYLGGGGRG